MIIAVGAQLLAFKIIFSFTDGLHVLLGALEHRFEIVMVLAIAHGLAIDDDLMLVVDQSLGIIALNHAVGGWHFRRFIVGDIALNLSFGLSLLRLVLFEKVIEAFDLPLETRFLLLPSLTIRLRQIVCADMLGENLG